ncbi:MAG: GNAT family N-acetyltransferase [Caldilineaceae bacterium]
MSESKLPIVIQPYTSAHWLAMWRLHLAQLAEHGIHLTDDAIPTVPGLPEHDRYEWDLNHIDEVYCRGGGGFWLAWQHEEPVGCVGGQDLGGVIELRRMYVRATHRRQGIGALLVQALIVHCRTQGINTVELWTDEGGMGQPFYEQLGFQQVQRPGPGFEGVNQATRRYPKPGEIRMQLKL